MEHLGSGRALDSRRPYLLAAVARSDEGAGAQSEATRQGRRRSLVRYRPDATAEGGAIRRAEGAIARVENRVGRPLEAACRDAAIRQDHRLRSPEPYSGKGGKRCVSVAAPDFHSRAAAHSADSGDQGESEIPEKVAAPFDRPARGRERCATRISGLRPASAWLSGWEATRARRGRGRLPRLLPDTSAMGRTHRARTHSSACGTGTCSWCREPH